MTGFAAAVVEAWQELRIHKLRVLLSLVGVGVAVCALTTAVAVGNIAQQSVVENYESESGRPASFEVYAYSQSGESPDVGEVRAAFATTMDELGVRYHSMFAETQGSVSTPKGSTSYALRVVDPPYADMRRVTPTAGRWFTTADAQNLSPAIVVDAKFLKATGIDRDALPAAVTLAGDPSVTATVVGAVGQLGYSTGMPTAYMLADSHQRWLASASPLEGGSFQMWVPPSDAKALGKAAKASLQRSLPGFSVEVNRQDYLARGDSDPLKEFRYALGGVSILILLLGALSLLNIALVTIQQRVREIGIRRSFGATGGRVFFSVMMESVVATFVAGLIGVITSVGLVNSSFVADRLFEDVTDVPAFPVSAGVLGLAVALAVGAVAGVLPAMIAVRVRIIDAIRF